MKNNIVLSPRSRVRLSQVEMDDLKQFIEMDSSAYSVITKNTGIERRTVIATLDRGWIEFKPAQKLRDFIKGLKKLTA